MLEKIIDLCRGAYNYVRCRGRGMLAVQRNVLETSWPPDFLAINKAHGWDWTVVFTGRPYAPDMQNMNDLHR